MRPGGSAKLALATWARATKYGGGRTHSPRGSLAAARAAVYASGAFAKAIRGTGPAREAKGEQGMEDCGASAWHFQQNVEMK